MWRDALSADQPDAARLHVFVGSNGRIPAASPDHLAHPFMSLYDKPCMTRRRPRGENKMLKADDRNGTSELVPEGVDAAGKLYTCACVRQDLRPSQASAEATFAAEGGHGQR